MPPRKAARSTRPDESLHALHVELLGIRPPIYREILVRSSVTLDRLHSLLLACFDWSGGHLHQFVVGDRLFTSADDGLDPGDEDEARVRLRDVLPRARSKLFYDYDFGDGWRIAVTTVRVRTFAPGGPRLPAAMLVDGARAAPPEDCGGIPGYEELCDAAADPNHPRREELLEWLDDEPFDPEAFPRDRIGARLAGFR